MFIFAVYLIPLLCECFSRIPVRNYTLSSVAFGLDGNLALDGNFSTFCQTQSGIIHFFEIQFEKDTQVTAVTIINRHGQSEEDEIIQRYANVLFKSYIHGL